MTDAFEAPHARLAIYQEMQQMTDEEIIESWRHCYTTHDEMNAHLLEVTAARRGLKLLLEKEEAAEKVSAYDSRPETYEHIGKVRQNISRAVIELLRRADAHDASKLVEPEVSAFDIATPKLQHLEYGSPEYKQSLKDLGPALKHHYRHNRHHPEFHPNGIADMSLIDVIEMLCDWKAASERMRKPTPAAPGHPEVPKYDDDFLRSIELNQERWGFSDDLCSLLKNTARELGFIPTEKTFASTVPLSVGEKITEALIERNMSQVDLARILAGPTARKSRVENTRRLIIKWIQGRHIPGPEYQRKLSAALDKPLGYWAEEEAVEHDRAGE